MCFVAGHSCPRHTLVLPAVTDRREKRASLRARQVPGAEPSAAHCCSQLAAATTAGTAFQDEAESRDAPPAPKALLQGNRGPSVSDRPAQSFSSRMARSAPPATPAEVEVTSACRLSSMNNSPRRRRAKTSPSRPYSGRSLKHMPGEVIPHTACGVGMEHTAMSVGS